MYIKICMVASVDPQPVGCSSLCDAIYVVQCAVCNHVMQSKPPRRFLNGPSSSDFETHRQPRAIAVPTRLSTEPRNQLVRRRSERTRSHMHIKQIHIQTHIYMNILYACLYIYTHTSVYACVCLPKRMHV